MRRVAGAAFARAGDTDAQIKECEQLGSEIALRLPWPKDSYRLEIVAKEERIPGKFLAQC